MKRALTIALLILTPTAALADEAKLDEPISLVLVDAVAADVLSSFAAFLEVEVALDPAIDGRLTIQLEEVSVRTAMQAACESLRCRWQLEAGTLSFTPAPARAPRPDGDGARASAFQPIDLELKDAGAAEFFHSLAQILEVDLVLDPAVRGKFSIALDNAGLEEVLREVCRELDCRAGLVTSAEGRTLEVRPRTSG